MTSSTSGLVTLSIKPRHCNSSNNSITFSFSKIKKHFIPRDEMPCYHPNSQQPHDYCLNKYGHLPILRRCHGRSRRSLKGNPLGARLQDHLRHRAACPVPSFGLSVRRRRCVLFSSQPIYIVMSIIRKNGGFVNIKSRNPDRTVPWCRAVPCRRPQPHGRDGRSSP